MYQEEVDIPIVIHIFSNCYFGGDINIIRYEVGLKLYFIILCSST